MKEKRGSGMICPDCGVEILYAGAGDRECPKCTRSWNQSNPNAYYERVKAFNLPRIRALFEGKVEGDKE